MPRYNSTEDFELGLSQLIPFFDAQGFSLTRSEPDVDREGTSYSARLIRHPRSVELSHLYSLGPVINSIRGYPALLQDLEKLAVAVLRRLRGRFQRHCETVFAGPTTAQRSRQPRSKLSRHWRRSPQGASS